MTINDVADGDIVKLDAGFTCRKEGEATIHKDKEGLLYFLCDQGRHYLAGQIDEDGELVGISAR